MRALIVAATIVSLGAAAPAGAQDTLDPEDAYRVNAGDLLEISVWREEGLQREVRVRPDGAFSFPLAGELMARGRTVAEIRAELEERLSQFIPDLVTTVTVVEVSGNQIFVIGQVVNPGAFVMNPALDVIQALSLAGGMTPFADLRNIRILRREGGQQTALRVDYTMISAGRGLERNVLLRSGDVVIVP